MADIDSDDIESFGFLRWFYNQHNICIYITLIDK